MKYRKLNGWKYELMEPLTIDVPGLRGITIYHPFIKIINGTLEVYDEYAWDGATGIPDNPDNMESSCFHDALYQLMREGLLDRKYKDVADRLFRDVSIAHGMPKNWADFFYDILKSIDGHVKPDKHPKGETVEI